MRPNKNAHSPHWRRATLRALAAALLCLALLCCLPTTAQAATEAATASDQTAQSDVQAQVNALDFSAWQQQLGESDVGDIRVTDWVARIASGQSAVEIQDVFALLLSGFSGQAGGYVALLLSLIALCLLSSLLTNLRCSFGGEGMGAFANYAFLLVLSAIVVQVLGLAVNIGKGAVEAMVGLSQAALPLLLGLLTALGSLAAVGIFQPAMALLTSTASTAVANVIFPVAMMGGTLCALGGFSERVQLTRMGGLLNSAVKWGMGILFTVFLGITSIQGLSAAAYDGVTVRAAKYAVGKSVPVVGGFVSDTFDMLMGSSAIVKNAVGVAGLLSLVAVVLTPLLQLLALSFALKLCAAVVQPVCDSKICDCLSGVAGTVTMIFAVVLVVAALFFITVAMILGAGNVNLMMRS